MLFGIVLLSFSVWDVIVGFPGGAPPNSCPDPAPIHQRRINSTHVGIFFPQSMATSPYKITTSASRYFNGSMIRGRHSLLYDIVNLE